MIIRNSYEVKVPKRYIYLSKIPLSPVLVPKKRQKDLKLEDAKSLSSIFNIRVLFPGVFEIAGGGFEGVNPLQRM